MSIVALAMTTTGVAEATVPQAAASPVVIAHRGASALRPEHTLGAYAQAIADGADFIEPDLVATRDGALVARHENEIGGTTDVADHPEFASRRTRKLIDGHAVEGWFSEDFTLAELKTLRARERLPELRGTRWDGQFQLLTLDEIIDFTAAMSASTGRTIGLIPEIKHPSYFQSLGLAMEGPLLAVLRAHAYTRHAPVVIQSFEVGNLRELRGRLPRGGNVQLLQLLGDPAERVPGEAPARRYAELMSAAGLREVAGYADAIGPATRSLIPLDAGGGLGEPTSLLRDAHAAGLRVQPYTFRPENRFLPPALRAGQESARNEAGSLAEIQAYLRLGIDGFFTDDPALGRRAVDGLRGR